MRGFTLIELLVVIAILGILVVGLMVAIDPADKLNAARDSRIRSDFGAVARASEAYATNNAGTYPYTINDLTTQNELKVIPAPPSGACGGTNLYDGGSDCDLIPSFNLSPGAVNAVCAAGPPTTCKSYVMAARLTSKKSIGLLTPPVYLRYESSTGMTCIKAALNVTAAAAIGAAVNCP